MIGFFYRPYSACPCSWYFSRSTLSTLFSIRSFLFGPFPPAPFPFPPTRIAVLPHSAPASCLARPAPSPIADVIAPFLQPRCCRPWPFFRSRVASRSAGLPILLRPSFCFLACIRPTSERVPCENFPKLLSCRPYLTSFDSLRSFLFPYPFHDLSCSSPLSGNSVLLYVLDRHLPSLELPPHTPVEVGTMPQLPPPEAVLVATQGGLSCPDLFFFNPFFRLTGSTNSDFSAPLRPALPCLAGTFFLSSNPKSAGVTPGSLPLLQSCDFLTPLFLTFRLSARF